MQRLKEARLGETSHQKQNKNSSHFVRIETPQMTNIQYLQQLYSHSDTLRFVNDLVHNRACTKSEGEKDPLTPILQLWYNFKSFSSIFFKVLRVSLVIEAFLHYEQYHTTIAKQKEKSKPQEFGR